MLLNELLQENFNRRKPYSPVILNVQPIPQPYTMKYFGTPFDQSEWKINKIYPLLGISKSKLLGK